MTEGTKEHRMGFHLRQDFSSLSDRVITLRLQRHPTLCRSTIPYLCYYVRIQTKLWRTFLISHHQIKCPKNSRRSDSRKQEHLCSIWKCTSSGQHSFYCCWKSERHLKNTEDFVNRIRDIWQSSSSFDGKKTGMLKVELFFTTVPRKIYTISYVHHEAGD